MISVRDEAMTLRGEFLPPLDVIEQLAIENHENTAVFVRHRLLTISQTDNAQASRGQRNSWSLKKSLLIWTAMHERARHPLHHSLRGWSFGQQIDDSCNAAHAAMIAEDADEESWEIISLP